MYFEKYATQNGFDPLNPHNWYTQPKLKFLSVKVRKRGASLYVHNLIPHISLCPLISIYPIFIHSSTADSPPLAFPLCQLAGFANFTNIQTGRVAYYHKGSVAQALSDLFPDIGLDHARLKRES